MFFTFKIGQSHQSHFFFFLPLAGQVGNSAMPPTGAENQLQLLLVFLLKTVGTGEKNCSVDLLSYFIEKTLSVSDVTAANTASSRSSLVATFVY